MKRKIVSSIIILVLVGFLGFGFYHFFFDTDALVPQSLIGKSVSPDGEYKINIYLQNGGATTGYAVLCVLHKNNDVNPIRNIYWNYPCDKAEIEWVDNDTVIINGVIIDDVFKDKYDWRYS